MGKQAYYTWENEAGRALAMEQTLKGLKNIEPVKRSNASSIYLNIGPGNVSVRDEFTRNDYENFRRGEVVPQKPKDIIAASMEAYRRFGLVHNVIDLMADFAVQGIDLNHPVERVEKFYKRWFKKVRGRSRSERFLNLLYRTANVIVSRQYAYLGLRQSRQMAVGDVETDIEVTTEENPGRRKVPWRYVFRNPLSVELLDDELSTFVGEDGFILVINIPRSIIGKVQQPSMMQEELVKKLPADLVKAIRRGETQLILDPSKVNCYYYKRDDWQPWAEPMLGPILVDLILLSKMKLADVAALDGAISNIRVWKLGNLELKMWPNEAVISKLAEMLTNNVGGGVLDLIWGPDIELVETSTEIHRFLGSTKYEPALNFIYQGLGIPPSLTGVSGSGGGGFTNNYMSLKTLIERLEYGRSVVTEFWEREIEIVQKAMGFAKPASLVFDRMTLNDEAAEKKLLMDMADRDLISWEYLVERFGATPEIEEVRLRRERRKRKSKQMPPKAGPYHEDQEYGLKKIFTQSGAYTPSEMDVQLKKKTEGEKTPIEMKPKRQVTSPSGQPGEGRPKNSRDTRKRKQRTVKPRRTVKSEFIENLLVAENMLGTIATHMSTAYLKKLGKKTLRELTEEEVRKLERAKFVVLCRHKIGEEITPKTIKGAISEKASLPCFAHALYEKTLERFRENRSQEPTLEIQRRFQSAVYTLWQLGDLDGNNHDDLQHSQQDNGL